MAGKGYRTTLAREDYGKVQHQRVKNLGNALWH